MKKNKLTRKVENITLGHEYTDTVHDRTGIATVYAIHLTGCNRVCCSYKNKDGDVKEFWVDETRLVDKDGNQVIEPENADKGPGTDPPNRTI